MLTLYLDVEQSNTVLCMAICGSGMVRFIRDLELGGKAPIYTYIYAFKCHDDYFRAKARDTIDPLP